MGIGFVFECLALAAGTAALIHHYKDAQVGPIVSCTVFFSWFVGFLGLVLLPMDLTSVNDRTNYESILVGWKLVYWFTFLLSWLVLPILIEFSQSGAFSTEQRLRLSIKYLVRHYAVLLSVGAIFFLYLIVVDHFSISGVIGLVMALGNTYGLLWIVCLLGYGLVNIPRIMWSYGDPQARLRSVYFKAIQVHDERVESTFIHDDVAKDVSALANRFHTMHASTIIVTPELQYTKECVDQLLRTIGADGDAEKAKVAKRQPRARTALPGPVLEDAMPTEAEIINLHGRAKRIKADLRRCDQTWNDICHEAHVLQQLVEKGDNMLLVPIAARACACVCILGSALIMWSEIVMGGAEWLSPLRYVLGSGPLTHVVVIALLLYMGICAYQSLFSLRGFGRLALHGNHNSTELSLLTTSIHQSRLQFSLGYNFLLLLNAGEVTTHTAFHALFTDMRLIHFFGTDFTLYAPLLLLVFAAFTFAHGYARVVRLLGLEQYEELIPGQVEHEAKIHTGEALVKRGIEKLARQWAKEGKTAASGLAAPLLADE
ncbi:hypothetical protein ACHHYP_03047 [Achlya hypogyna]|uniref:LMBR1 domain-containing protein 2 n=1 Tax=Achlya hypogyna TaxID=1202772 RepID=A0A1V9Z561_ACHHY|nr:hypothetical protein ACHHYP_03047 [Achlya hypogyna]